MAPLLLRRSIRNRKIDDDDENGNGKNGERNGTSKHNKGNSKNISVNERNNDSEIVTNINNDSNNNLNL